MLSIADILFQYPTKLLNSDTPHLDCRLLLQHITGREQAWLIAHDDACLTPQQWQVFLQLFEKRLKGMPIAYLIGQREFWGLSFAVTPEVLIPRPDTETLVIAALEYAASLGGDKNISILDLGVGSGAIAVALASELPNVNVLASDISQVALSVARQNALRLEIDNIDFVQSNWFADIPPQTFDIIVSNPPYIDNDDPHLNADGVRYEPVSALVAEKNGLADIEALVQQARQFMHEGSRLFLEHGYDQAGTVRQLFEKYSYDNILLAHDLAGHIRVTSAKLIDK